MFLEGSDLGLHHFDVFRKSLHGVGLGLPSLELGDNGVLSVGESVPVKGISNTQDQENGDEGSQDSQSLNTLSEKEGQSQQESRDDQKASDNVKKREDSEDASGLSETAGSIEGNVAHEWNRVPNKDSGDVEEQVGKGDLHGFSGGKQSSKKSSDGSSDVGSQSDREHLFKTDDVHTDQRSEDRGGNGRRLDKDGNTDSDKDGKVSVDVGGLVNNAGRHTHEHLLEQVDHAEKADEQEDQTNDENGNTRNLVIRSAGINLEKGRAGIGTLVAGNETDLRAGRLGRVFRILADNWVVVTARFSLGNTLDDVLVSNDNLLGEGSNELLDRSNPLLSITGFEVSDAEGSQSSEVSGDEFDRQEDTDSQKVEHVVNGGSSESAFELISISHLSHGDNGVGDLSNRSKQLK